MILTIVAMARVRKNRFNWLKSFVAAANPTPTIGPIRGEMSIAPMITAVEFTLSPILAMKIAKMSVQRLEPTSSAPFWMDSIVPGLSKSSRRWNRGVNHWKKVTIGFSLDAMTY